MVKIEFNFKGVEFFGYIKDLFPEVFGSITSYTKVIKKYLLNIIESLRRKMKNEKVIFAPTVIDIYTNH